MSAVAALLSATVAGQQVLHGQLVDLLALRLDGQSVGRHGRRREGPRRAAPVDTKITKVISMSKSCRIERGRCSRCAEENNVLFRIPFQTQGRELELSTLNRSRKMFDDDFTSLGRAPAATGRAIERGRRNSPADRVGCISVGSGAWPGPARGGYTKKKHRQKTLERPSRAQVP